VYSTVDLYNKAMTLSGQNLPFPQTPVISAKLKALLKRMIEPDPKKRMTWHELFNHELLREDIEAKAVVGCDPSRIEQTNMIFNQAKDRVSKDTITLNKPEEFEDLFSSEISGYQRSLEEARTDSNQGQKYLNNGSNDFEEDWEVFDRDLFSLDSQDRNSTSVK
jgi:serine/threonine protein kinase